MLPPLLGGAQLVTATDDDNFFALWVEERLSVPLTRKALELD
jgi:hypothetical protein